METSVQYRYFHVMIDNMGIGGTVNEVSYIRKNRTGGK